MNAAICGPHGLRERRGYREILENKVLVQVGQLLVASLVFQLRSLPLHTGHGLLRLRQLPVAICQVAAVTVLWCWISLRGSAGLGEGICSVALLIAARRTAGSEIRLLVAMAAVGWPAVYPARCTIIRARPTAQENIGSTV